MPLYYKLTEIMRIPVSGRPAVSQRQIGARWKIKNKINKMEDINRKVVNKKNNP